MVGVVSGGGGGVSVGGVSTMEGSWLEEVSGIAGRAGREEGGTGDEELAAGVVEEGGGGGSWTPLAMS